MFFGRAALPAQYEDFVTTVGGKGLTLPTPVPQFFLANAAMAGRFSAAAMQAGMTGGRMIEIMGGGAQHPGLAQLVTIESQIPGLINVIEEFNSSKTEGDTLKFMRPVYSVGGLGELDRALSAQVAIGTTGRAASLEEVPMTLHEYVGPYASGGSAVQPFEVRQFDALYRANKIALATAVAHHLSYDYMNWLDSVLMCKFCRATRSGTTWTSADTTYLTFSDSTFTLASDYVAAGGSQFSCEQLLRARQTLRDRYVNPFPNGRYVALVPTSWVTHLVGDVQYREMSKAHADGRNLIFGYISSIEDIDIYECNTLPTYAAAGTYGGAVIAAGVTINEGILVGPGAVGFGCALPPEVRSADDTNYQTAAKMIWYAVQAQEVLDDRYVQRFCAQTT